MEKQCIRLRKARLRAGFAHAKDAAKAFGWKYEAYKAHESGRNGLREHVARRYGAAFHVSAGWLMTGDNPPKWAGSNPPRKVHLTKAVPVLTAEEATEMPGEFSRLAEAAKQVVTLDARADIGPRCYARVIDDESMVASQANAPDNFRLGDIVVFNPDKKPRPGDYVDAQVSGEKQTIFRKYRPRVSPSGTLSSHSPRETSA